MALLLSMNREDCAATCLNTCLTYKSSRGRAQSKEHKAASRPWAARNRKQKAGSKKATAESKPKKQKAIHTTIIRTQEATSRKQKAATRSREGSQKQKTRGSNLKKKKKLQQLNIPYLLSNPWAGRLCPGLSRPATT